MKIRAIPTALAGLLIIEPTVFGDERGFFMESYNRADFHQATGVDPVFVQDNHSRSVRGVLRGLHFQAAPRAQGKLVRVVDGSVYDVAVDIRVGSPTFGQWVGEVLSAENHRQMWIPAGFAHGFVVTSERADFLYKTTDFQSVSHERAIRWDDPELAIDWPLDVQPKISAKDAAAPLLRDVLTRLGEDGGN